MVSLYPAIRDGNLNPMFNVLCVMFFHGIVSLSPIEINRIFCVDTLRLYNINILFPHLSQVLVSIDLA
jgi:hypothetical protein